MKKLGMAMIAAAAMITLSQTVRAADFEPVEPSAEPMAGWYVRGDIGWSFLEWGGGSDDDAIALGIGAGYRFSPNMRFDVRGNFAGDYDIGAADADVWSVTANGYFDIPTGTMVTPYLGAGLGWGWANISPGNDRDGLALALMGGASIDISQTTAIDVGYRYQNVGINGPDTHEHQIMTGIRFGF